jgi:hypothetical protein
MVARGGGIEELTSVTLPTDRRKGGMDKRHEGGGVYSHVDGWRMGWLDMACSFWQRAEAEQIVSACSRPQRGCQRQRPRVRAMQSGTLSICRCPG